MIRLVERFVAPFLTARFAKFAAVGASGVAVNLGTLAVLRHIGVHTNVASALAIEVSILSNFLINHLWTFRDRRLYGQGLIHHGIRFHLVSLVGGAFQFLTFVALNMAWLHLRGGVEAVARYQAGAHDAVERHLWRPLVSPPDVGSLVFPSQIGGIAVATAWNYLVNFYWTWANVPPCASPSSAPRERSPDPSP